MANIWNLNLKLQYTINDDHVDISYDCSQRESNLLSIINVNIVQDYSLELLSYDAREEFTFLHYLDSANLWFIWVNLICQEIFQEKQKREREREREN